MWVDLRGVDEESINCALSDIRDAVSEIAKNDSITTVSYTHLLIIGQTVKITVSIRLILSLINAGAINIVIMPDSIIFLIKRLPV